MIQMNSLSEFLKKKSEPSELSKIKKELFDALLLGYKTEAAALAAGVSQSTASRALKVMREIGLIKKAETKKKLIVDMILSGKKNKVIAREIKASEGHVRNIRMDIRNAIRNE